MAARHRIIFLLALGVALSVSCGANKKEVERARKSVYDTDFANVYNAALQATRDLYPLLQDSPGPGRISTAWHQVQYGNTQDDLQNTRTLSQGQGFTGSAGSPQATMTGMPTRLAYKRYFIRMDVSVVGGRPWRVKVVGHATEWDPGAAMPSAMTGAQRPAWLDGRIEALQVAIYKRIKPYAITMKEETTETPEEVMPKTDPKTFIAVPMGAAVVLANVKDAIAKRDYVALRPQLADDIVWSQGGGTGADAALATWQADPTILDAMQGAISAGCAGGDKRVSCPPGDAKVGTFQLVVEDKGKTWQVTSFVRIEPQ